jgi:hypothetical protein
MVVPARSNCQEESFSVKHRLVAGRYSICTVSSLFFFLARVVSLLQQRLYETIERLLSTLRVYRVDDTSTCWLSSASPAARSLTTTPFSETSARSITVCLSPKTVPISSNDFPFVSGRINHSSGVITTSAER